MEPRLGILIQLVLEFASIIAVVVQKRKDFRDNLSTDKDIPFKEIQASLRNFSDLIPVSNSLEEFEQTKILQQQLAVYYRQTQFELARKERETALKLPEVHKILES
ncbi:hypothetical protein H6G17_02815 [Chroococcidiopsis sp. FACHB-1243]|uniref:hypothetical protein n=1 Tax=Chroococcidiopsis sp. [FACHB-1243] TaxID=2692781 RepID=UPI00177FB0C2|nr:hypothetical protein [Chroococcidiopsis sp. [FACHB-1243]]MBD2304454.1 hypothetical protein [Chroococcidiopsis sp. [FACHB-1243]]